jgi:hypothetical protein
MRPEVAALVRELEESQRVAMQDLGKRASRSEDEIRRNYRLMQVFDLLALYFCCDGYAGDEMKETTLDPIPVAYGSNQEAILHIASTGANVLRFDPYPFQRCPLQVSLAGRVVPRLTGRSEAECCAEFLSAQREHLTWTITN